MLRHRNDHFERINGRAQYPLSAMPVVNRDPRLADMTVNIRMFATDVDGNIIDKNTLPIGLRVDYAYNLFGEFDRQGGYKVMQQTTAPQGTSEYIGVFTHGVTEGFLQFNTQGNIYEQLQIGDIYFMYTDSTINPNFFVFIIVSNPFASMGSITASTAWHRHQGGKLRDHLEIEHFKLIAENLAQYNTPLFLIGLDDIGVSKNDSINPLASRDIDDKQPDFIQVTIPIKINAYTGIASFIRFTSNVITYQFKLRY